MRREAAIRIAIMVAFIIIALTLSHLLSGCDWANDDYTPAFCRTHGNVNVLDGDEHTGVILAEYKATPSMIKQECQKPFDDAHGCAVAVNIGEYVIYYLDGEALVEERCHVYFEEKDHVAGRIPNR